MPNSQKGTRAVDAARYELSCAVELARGTSHIASTLTPATLQQAVAEVLRAFQAERGREPFEAFQWLLAERLERRGRADAAQAVRAYGVVPGKTAQRV